MRQLSDSGELTEHDLEQVAGGMEQVKKPDAKEAAPKDAVSPGAEATKKKAAGTEGVAEQEKELKPPSDPKKLV